MAVTPRPPMSLLLREACVDDAPDVERLTRQLGYSPSIEHVTASLSRILGRPGERFVMADLDGQAVGWIHAVVADYVDVEPFVLIAGLVVDARVRRQGVGRRLMTHVEEWARLQGCNAVRLSSSSTRVAAHRFYESIGFTNIKTQYSFAKSLTGDSPATLRTFVPNVNQKGGS